jgi:hypothetical protein
LAIEALNGVEELLLDGGNGRVGIGRKLSAEKGGAADFGGDAQGARDLGEGHFLEVIIAEAFEKALSCGEELLGSNPFLFAKAVEAFRPVSGLFTLPFGFVVSLLLKEAGVERLEPLEPIIFGGPVFKSGKVFAGFVGYGLEGASLAEIEIDREG